MIIIFVNATKLIFSDFVYTYTQQFMHECTHDCRLAEVAKPLSQRKFAPAAGSLRQVGANGRIQEGKAKVHTLNHAYILA